MDGLLYALVAFVAIDFLSGALVAFEQKRLSSSVGFRGVARKVLLFCLVGIGHTLDTHVLGGGLALCTATICYLLSNRGKTLFHRRSVG